MGKETRPTLAIPVHEFRSLVSQTFPSPVRDADRGVRALFGEVDLDLGRRIAIAPDVPQIDEPCWRLPDEHLAPIVLGPLRCSLEDPAAGARLEREGLMKWVLG
jgi:hypothetical protein